MWPIQTSTKSHLPTRNISIRCKQSRRRYSNLMCSSRNIWRSCSGFCFRHTAELLKAVLVNTWGQSGCACPVSAINTTTFRKLHLVTGTKRKMYRFGPSFGELSGLYPANDRWSSWGWLKYYQRQFLWTSWPNTWLRKSTNCKRGQCQCWSWSLI